METENSRVPRSQFATWFHAKNLSRIFYWFSHGRRKLNYRSKKGKANGIKKKKKKVLNEKWREIKIWVPVAKKKCRLKFDYGLTLLSSFKIWSSFRHFRHKNNYKKPQDFKKKKKQSEKFLKQFRFFNKTSNFEIICGDGSSNRIENKRVWIKSICDVFY